MVQPTKCNTHNFHSTSYTIIPTTTNDESLLEHRYDVKRKCLLQSDPLCAVYIYIHIHIKNFQSIKCCRLHRTKIKKIWKTTLTNGIYYLHYKYLHILQKISEKSNKASKRSGWLIVIMNCYISSAIQSQLGSWHKTWTTGRRHPLTIFQFKLQLKEEIDGIQIVQNVDDIFNATEHFPRTIYFHTYSSKRYTMHRDFWLRNEKDYILFRFKLTLLMYYCCIFLILNE